MRVTEHDPEVKRSPKGNKVARLRRTLSRIYFFSAERAQHNKLAKLRINTIYRLFRGCRGVTVAILAYQTPIYICSSTREKFEEKTDVRENKVFLALIHSGKAEQALCSERIG